MLIDIAEVSRRSGLAASALRFYEEKGLIVSAGRRGMRRLFDAKVLERLAMIALGRAGGFSLDEIAQFLRPDGGFRIDRARLSAKADELDGTIRSLTRALMYVTFCGERGTYEGWTRGAASGITDVGHYAREVEQWLALLQISKETFVSWAFRRRSSCCECSWKNSAARRIPMWSARGSKKRRSVVGISTAA